MSLKRWLSRQVIGPYREIKRPAFPVNPDLEAQAKAVRARWGLGDPKPLIEDNPDTWRRPQPPVDWDDLPAA
jgi:hypothetical protein